MRVPAAQISPPQTFGSLVRKSCQTTISSILPRGLHGRDSILILGGVIDCAGSNSPNEKIAVPEAMATYCLPSTAYEIGDAVSFSPVWKCQRCLPVRPSSPT